MVNENSYVDNAYVWVVPGDTYIKIKADCFSLEEPPAIHSWDAHGAVRCQYILPLVASIDTQKILIFLYSFDNT